VGKRKLCMAENPALVERIHGQCTEYCTSPLMSRCRLPGPVEVAVAAIGTDCIEPCEANSYEPTFLPFTASLALHKICVIALAQRLRCLAERVEGIQSSGHHALVLCASHPALSILGVPIW
jgi:hypothetical protein